MRENELIRLYDKGPLRIRAIHGSSRRLLAIFTGGAAAELPAPRPAVNRHPGLSSADHVLFITDKARNWYSSPGIGSDIRIQVRNYIRDNGIDEATALGASMGGYGGILFSDLFRTVIALNPQISMHPSVVGHRTDHLLRRNWRKLQPVMGPRLERSVAPSVTGADTEFIVIYGDVEYIDRMQKTLLPDAPNLHVFTVRGADHGLWDDLEIAGLMKDVINAGCRRDLVMMQWVCQRLETMIANGQIDRARGKTWVQHIAGRCRRSGRKLRSAFWEFRRKTGGIPQG